MANGDSLFVIQVSGGIEPEVTGPYDTPEQQLEAARAFRNENEDNVSFWLDISPSGIPDAGSYSGGAMEPVA